MKIRLVKQKDIEEQASQPSKTEKPNNPAAGPQRWVEEFKNRKAEERAQIFTLLNHDAA